MLLFRLPKNSFLNFKSLGQKKVILSFLISYLSNSWLRPNILQSSAQGNTQQKDPKLILVWLREQVSFASTAEYMILPEETSLFMSTVKANIQGPVLLQDSFPYVTVPAYLTILNLLSSSIWHAICLLKHEKCLLWFKNSKHEEEEGWTLFN